MREAKGHACVHSMDQVAGKAAVPVRLIMRAPAQRVNEPTPERIAPAVLGRW